MLSAIRGDGFYWTFKTSQSFWTGAKPWQSYELWEMRKEKRFF